MMGLEVQKGLLKPGLAVKIVKTVLIVFARSIARPGGGGG